MPILNILSIEIFSPRHIGRRYFIDASIKGSSKPFFVRSQTVDKDIWAPFQVSFVKTSGGKIGIFKISLSKAC